MLLIHSTSIKFQLNRLNTCNFIANLIFFLYQEAFFWDESRASQESDGPMVQSNLNDILITHVKFYRQWLLNLIYEISLVMQRVPIYLKLKSKHLIEIMSEKFMIEHQRNLMILREQYIMLWNYLKWLFATYTLYKLLWKISI